MTTRTKNIKIRLTDGEHRRLKNLAGARGISAFMRTSALGVDRRQKQIERFSVLAELARARNILSQIARASERRTLPEQIQIVVQLIAVERQLSNLKKP